METEITEEKMKIMTGFGFRFKRVRTTDDYNELVTFANSFDHQIPNNYDVHSIIMMYNQNNSLIGYFQIVNLPVIFPAFTTDESVASKRDIAEAAKALSNYQKMAREISNNDFLLVTEEISNFDEETMKKMGYKPLKSKVYYNGDT